MLKFKLIPIFLLVLKLVYCQYPVKGYNLDNPTFLDSTVADYNVFFTAEWHWRKENTERMKKMIQYLTSTNGLDVIVVERSFDFGHWVNYFIETGDSLLLSEFLSVDDFFSAYHGKLLQDEYSFYRWLRNYIIKNNLSIRVIGIDLHAYWDEEPILWSFLKFTEQDTSLQKPLETHIIEAKKLLNEQKVSIHRMLRWFRKLESTSADLETDNQNFVNFIFSLRQSVKYAHGSKYNYRERQIAFNFRKYVHKGEKVYGQFGLGHTMLQPEYWKRAIPFRYFFQPYKYKSFAYLLHQDSDYAGRILSIGRVCFNCKDIGPYYGEDIYIPFMTEETFERLKPELMKVPDNTIIDLRNSSENMKANCQLLLIEID